MNDNKAPEKSIGYFQSITFGLLSNDAVRKKVVQFINKEPNKHYRLIIGTDSEVKKGEGTDFVTAFLVHRVGTGGMYFWRRKQERKTYVLKTRMYEEASLSLMAASEIIDMFKSDGIGRYDFEIHVDIGQKGETREVINEIVGMIRGSGFAVKIKPFSFVASKVADRHT